MVKEKKKREDEVQGFRGWLYGWKDISSYCGCDITTSRKYASEFKMPVRRLPNKKVVAIPDELDRWLKDLKIP